MSSSFFVAAGVVPSGAGEAGVVPAGAGEAGVVPAGAGSVTFALVLVAASAALDAPTPSSFNFLSIASKFS